MSLLNEIQKFLDEKRVEMRNRSEPIFQSTNSKVKDNKDHFPIDTINRARNALARVNQYDTSPDWYNGSLSELKNKVISAVHKKYPSIKISKKSKE